MLRPLLASLTLLLTQADPTIPLGQPVRLDHPFTSITGARPLSDGRILLTDRRERQFLIVDHRLQNVTNIGREGRGPGEFLAPADLLALPGDSTAMVDPGLMRLTTYDGVRLPAATRSMFERGLTLFWPTGADDASWYYHDPDVNRVVNGAVHVMRSARRGGAASLVASLSVPPQLQPGRAREGWGAAKTGYFVRDAYAVAADGWVGIVRWSPYHIEWVAPDGRRVSGPPRRVPQIPVTEADKVAWADAQARMVGMLTDDRGGRGRVPVARPDISRVEFPATFPPFHEDGVIAAASGELWVRRFIPDRLGRSEYDVFGRDGRLRGVVRLNGRHRVLAVTTQFVWLAARDSDDTEWLERRPLP